MHSAEMRGVVYGSGIEKMKNIKNSRERKDNELR